MTIDEAIAALEALRAEHGGGVDLVVEVGREWPPDERDVASIGVAYPYDTNTLYTNLKRAVIRADGLDEMKGRER